MRRLPLFPLPMVLLPGALTPLHVFEPRYRQMVAHCLESDKQFGLVYHDPDRHGPFHPEPGKIGCVARIEEFEPQPDGRSFIMVLGTERFRIADGIESDALYYEALVSEYLDGKESPERIESRAEDVDTLFRETLDRLIESDETIPPLNEDYPASYQLARWIKIDPAWQQALLESRSELHRLRKIQELLQTV